ncbi:hypothetical protein CZ814_01318 [Photobacterium toruni]|uniref:Uncharacterized protein n=1 Tax=Photobacterium toruni TaxID=1935446 RepID=A0A1T4RHW4_9GAMM|nr:hypothetical protein CZ814_01318 [Photobacterium toruni]
MSFNSIKTAKNGYLYTKNVTNPVIPYLIRNNILKVFLFKTTKEAIKTVISLTYLTTPFMANG